MPCDIFSNPARLFRSARLLGTSEYVLKHISSTESKLKLIFSKPQTPLVCNFSPDFIPRRMKEYEECCFFCSSGLWGMKIYSLGIPGVLRSKYLHDFVDVEGKKGVIIKSGL